MSIETSVSNTDTARGTCTYQLLICNIILNLVPLMAGIAFATASLPKIAQIDLIFSVHFRFPRAEVLDVRVDSP
jgi:hypothetical protein